MQKGSRRSLKQGAYSALSVKKLFETTVAPHERHENHTVTCRKLRGGGRCFLRIALLVPFDATRRVHELLASREKRMTVGADFEFQVTDGGTSFKGVSTNT